MGDVWYNLLLPLSLPWVRLRLWWKGLQEPSYQKRLPERFGYLPFPRSSGGIWIHTVSAGETISAAPLIRKLTREHPDASILVTTMTPAGSVQVSRMLGERVHHCYAPYDYPWMVTRFLDQLNPALLILVETELWPNWVRCCHERNIPVLLVNARLSERSARGYHRLGSLSRNMMQRLSWVGCQSPAHAERFRRLGVAEDRLLVCGNLKFDLDLPGDLVRRARELKTRWRRPQDTSSRSVQRPIWVAASTHPGEDEPVLKAHEILLKSHPDLLLLLVPRHPERARGLLKLARQKGLSANLISSRRPENLQVAIADNMGQLLLYYQVSDVAFIGGSLVPAGGHNMIEAAACGLPLLMGPSDYNFEQAAQLFQREGCLGRVSDAESLADAVQTWLSNPELGLDLGERARALVAESTGATARLMQQIEVWLRTTGRG